MRRLGGKELVFAEGFKEQAEKGRTMAAQFIPEQHAPLFSVCAEEVLSEALAVFGRVEAESFAQSR